VKTFEKIEHEYLILDDVITTNQLANLVSLSSYSIRKLTHQGILKKLESSSSNYSRKHIIPTP